ncbi:MAG TPA: TrmH family RNA methyltransferase [Candidatus Azoamicus sp. OHIO2]
MKTELIYKLNAIKNLLYKNPSVIKTLYILKLNYRVFKLIKLAEKRKIKIKWCYYIFNNRLQYLFFTYYLISTISTIKYKDTDLIMFLQKDKLKILILYKMQDPHNLASCIRSAEAFGFDFLILTTKDTTKITTLINNFSHATSIFLPIFLTKNIRKTLSLLKKKQIKIFGFSVKASEMINYVNIDESCAIIMGSEKYGITPFIAKQCDLLYKIPTLGLCDSINVSVATGIIMYKLTYQ